MRIRLNTQEAYMCLRLLLNTKSRHECEILWKYVLPRSTCGAHFLIEPFADCSGFYLMYGTPAQYILYHKAYIGDYKGLDYFITDYLIKKKK